ncbi:MAG: ATP-dependent 6-phosphofructokinase, partial [Elusimicrobia bacterium]|nr:ATP-dependent 6-phosphofructokinase [Elusimicrobiota bacterium]
MKTKIVEIDKLGPAEIISPLVNREWINFVTDENSVISTLHQDELMPEINNGVLEFFELAGPRRKIYFDLKDLKCGIVTCGGLCPGINDIIRELVFELWQEYGVEDIEGFRYGYMGIAEADKITPIKLTPELTDSIHRDGGTILGSSRGPQDTGVMVDSLVKRGIKILFTVGGDGTMKGAHELAKEIKRRGLDISVIGIPKTIDNDIDYVENSFGFETSVQAAADIIDSAHNESKGAPDCIGLVKLMGRASGFIAAHTALANRDVNYCLIPELGFRLEGPGGFLEVLKERLRIKRHAVIVVAEGAGQELMNHGDGEVKRDKSG